jgi:HK97 gp10 family phage protein
MPIELEGMDQLMKNLEKTGADVRRATIKALRKGSGIVRDAISERARHFKKGYSTGNIAESVTTVAAEDEEGSMGTWVFVNPNKAPYAVNVEFGTRNMEAQPFFEPGFLESREKAMAAMRDSIKASIERGRIE